MKRVGEVQAVTW